MVELPKEIGPSLTIKDLVDAKKRISAEERFKSIGVWDDLMTTIGSEGYRYETTTTAGADEATAMSLEMLKEMTKKLEDPTPPKSASEMYFSEQETLMEKFKEAGATAKRIQNLIQEAPINPTPLEHDFSFELSAPLSVTVGQLIGEKPPFGTKGVGYIDWILKLVARGEIKAYTEYKKLPMIGGEKFRPVDAYVGKSGKCFIRFIERPPDSEIRTLTYQQYVEFDYETALNVLSGFREYISNAFHTFDDKVGEDGLAAVLEDFKLAANKLYGSW